MKKRNLTKGNVTAVMLLFAVPMILGNIMQQCYNLADTWIVGRFVGAEALAAVGSAYTLMTFLNSILIGMCMGSGALFSICYGRRALRKLKEYIVSSFVLIFSVTVILTIVSYVCLDPILTLMQIPADIYGLMRSYMGLILAGLIFVFLYNYFAFLLRSSGNSVIPLIFLGVGTALNIGLDFFFVAKLGRGVKGAAEATVLAQGVVQGFNVVRAQLLHLHFPDIGDDEVLDERQIGLVGLGCPLVLAALLGQPVHQELRYRHGGRDQKVACCQFMLDLLLAFDRLLFRGKALPFVAALAVLVLIGVADTVRAAAFRDISHRFASLSSCPVEPRIEAVFRDADASACPQDTELGGAVAQVVGGTLADSQHLCDLLHRVHQLCGLRAVGRRLDGIGSSDHLHCSRIRVRLQELFRIIQRFHILVHFITHRHCSLLIMAHRRLLRAAFVESNDLRRDAVQRFQGGFIVLPQLGILQTLQDAPFLRFVQRGRERLIFLFQLSVLGGGLRKGDLIAVQFGAHFGHCRDIAVQHLADLRRMALAVEGIDAYQQGIQLLLLLGQLDHLLEDARRDVLSAGLAGAFASFQLRVTLDHVLPELVLPLDQLFLVADNLFGTQPSVSGQGHKAEMQMGRFLVHVDDCGEKGIRALLALQEFQGILKVRIDLAVRLAFEELRAGGDKSLHHTHAVLADTAVGGGYHTVGFFPVPALRLHQMKVVEAPARVDIRVAGVLLLGALVVGFDGADGRPLVLFEPQDSILGFHRSRSFLGCTKNLYGLQITCTVCTAYGNLKYKR